MERYGITQSCATRRANGERELRMALENNDGQQALPVTIDRIQAICSTGAITEPVISKRRRSYRTRGMALGGGRV